VELWSVLWRCQDKGVARLRREEDEVGCTTFTNSNANTTTATTLYKMKKRDTYRTAGQQGSRADERPYHEVGQQGHDSMEEPDDAP